MDDPRNTDNAWVETAAYHVHDSHGFFSKFDLLSQKGTDSSTPLEVGWVVVHRDLKLYAEHLALLYKVVRLKNAYWGESYEKSLVE